MSREPLELTWEGGEHKFYLGIRELRALQEKCDAGPGWIFQRLERGDWRVDDIIQPIRLGLEGAGMEKAAARKLVQTHVESEPLTASVILAHVILAGVLYSPEGDPVGESNRPEAGDTDQPEQESPSSGESSDFH